MPASDTFVIAGGGLAGAALTARMAGAGTRDLDLSQAAVLAGLLRETT